MSKRLLVTWVACCGSLFASQTGGSGTSVIGPPPPTVRATPPSPRQSAVKKQPVRSSKRATSAARLAKPAKSAKFIGPRLALSALPLGSSMGGPAGVKSVVTAALPAYYYSGDHYIAPWGSDANPCSFQQPCQTLTGIQSSLTAPTVVLLRGGIYPPSSTVSSAATLTATSITDTITYAAYPGEVPIITGAVPLTGWTDASSNCGGSGAPIANCWSAPISTLNNFDYLLYVPAGWPPSYIPYVMSRRTQSVNTPTGYNMNVQPCGGSSSICVEVNTSELTSSGFCAVGGPCSPHHSSDVKFYNFHASNVDALQLSLATYGTPTTQLTFVNPSLTNLVPQARYLIVNSVEFFTQNATPGTFYINCTSHSCVPTSGSATITGTIYYIAQGGENPPTDLILAPQSPAILSAPASSLLQNVTVQGIAFVGDNFAATPGGYVSIDGQPNIPAAVSFVDTQNVVVDSSIVAHTSGWGLEFTNDYYPVPNTGCGCGVNGTSAYNQLTNSVLFDIGTSAVRLGRYPPDTVTNMDTGNTDGQATKFTLVQNNLFSGTGRMYPGGEDGCVEINSSHDNTVQYNECVDSYGGGVAIGPSVGVTSDFEYNNTVQYNLFHDLGRGVIADFGCVHFANRGGEPSNKPPGNGDQFLNNICHDITSAPDLYGPNGGTGIYIDNDSQWVTANNNLIYRTSGALFFNNVSPHCIGSVTCHNTVSNNILAYSYAGAIKRGGTGTQGDQFLDFTFSNNIVYFDQQNLSNGHYQSNGPQHLDATPPAFWTCNTGGFPTPCTAYFKFASNDYWNPNLSASDVRFYTSDASGTPTPLTFTNNLFQWQYVPTIDEDIGSGYANPNFPSPGFPNDNYDCGGSCPGIFTPFDLTVQGRNHPLIFPRPTPPGFPLQLVSPYQF